MQNPLPPRSCALGTASSPAIQGVVRGHTGKADLLTVLRVVPKLLLGRLRGRSLSRTLTPSDLKRAAMAVPPSTGQLLYLAARTIGARSVVEFGTSFGMSAIYLASAVKDNGGGTVIGTEIELDKAKAARMNLDRCGLAGLVDIRVGDALGTLAADVPTLDLVFLDGWKDLYLPVLKLLEPRLRDRALVLADNLHTFPGELRSYLDYVTQPGGQYVTSVLPIDEGVAYSVRCTSQGM